MELGRGLTLLLLSFIFSVSISILRLLRLLLVFLFCPSHFLSVLLRFLAFSRQHLFRSVFTFCSSGCPRCMQASESTWLYFFAVLWVAAELELRRRFIAGSCMHCYRWPGMHVPKTTCISHRTTFWALMVINSVLLEFLITSSWRWTSCLFLLHWTIRGSNSHSAASRPRARLRTRAQFSVSQNQPV